MLLVQVVVPDKRVMAAGIAWHVMLMETAILKSHAGGMIAMITPRPVAPVVFPAPLHILPVLMVMTRIAMELSMIQPAKAGHALCQVTLTSCPHLHYQTIATADAKGEVLYPEPLAGQALHSCTTHTILRHAVLATSKAQNGGLTGVLELQPARVTLPIANKP